jgi:hypothetical protein
LGSTLAEVQENEPALDRLWRARFRWNLRPRHVTGDIKYGTIECIAGLEHQHIRADFPLSEVGHRAGSLGLKTSSVTRPRIPGPVLARSPCGS